MCSNLFRQRLLTLFLLGLLLWFSPLIERFEALGQWRGVPILFIYLFVSWAAIIAVSAWILSRDREQ